MADGDEKKAPVAATLGASLNNPFVSNFASPPPASTLAGPRVVEGDDAQPLFAIHTMVDGFFVLSLLGEGGMGQVLEAEDRVLGRRVALKVAHPNLDRGWLRQEARALASVRHPSLLQVHGFGTFGGLDYLVLERIFGVDLHGFIARRSEAKEPVPIADALDILLRIAEALAEIHSAGLVHFDIKPSNVMLAPKGRVVLMDFGLARAESAVQRLRAIEGTPAYIAPEVIRGAVDPRLAFLVDAYALGVLAFELLTGATPYSGATVKEMLERHLDAEVPSLAKQRADIPKKLDGLITELLAKDPLERPPSLEAVAWRLRKLRAASSWQEESFRVLVVDADAASADYLSRMIRAGVPGAVINIANTAEQAIAQVRAAPVHLLFVDLQLPDMSGLELAMYLRGTHLAARCRIIVLSSGAQWGDVGLLRQLGITDFVRKGELLSERVRPILHLALEELQYRGKVTGA
jgi:CheY-like chemotaxis protein